MSVVEATGKPCDVCPWRVANQGKRHPGGWYTKTNLRRLWSKLRRGDSMSCHATDPRVLDRLPETVSTRVCSGAVIIQQREFMKMQTILLTGGTIAQYLRENPLGLTRGGAAEIVAAQVFAPVTGPGHHARPNLNQPGIGHPDLTWDYASIRPVPHEGGDTDD